MKILQAFARDQWGLKDTIQEMVSWKFPTHSQRYHTGLISIVELDFSKESFKRQVAAETHPISVHPKRTPKQINKIQELSSHIAKPIL